MCVRWKRCVCAVEEVCVCGGACVRWCVCAFFCAASAFFSSFVSFFSKSSSAPVFIPPMPTPMPLFSIRSRCSSVISLSSSFCMAKAACLASFSFFGMVNSWDRFAQF